jgi:hypothetical protein
VARCKKCEEGTSTAYYRKLKKENPKKYNEVLKSAREVMRANYAIIKKNPKAYKIFRGKKNEINRAYEKRKRDEKLKTGWQPKPGYRNPVLARDKDGNIVANFPSIKEAAKAIKRNRSGLSVALKKKTPCAGLYFEYVNSVKPRKKSKRPKVKPYSPNAKHVIARDRNGKLVARFTSIGEAARTIKRARPNVRRSIRTKLACGGYYFEEA